MQLNSSLFQPLPVINSKCFTQSEMHPRGRKKNSRPELVLTVSPEANEKEIIIQRVPLVIEYLQNNWTLHGQPKKNDGSRKKSVHEAISYAAESSSQPQTIERQSAKNSETEQKEGFSERAEHLRTETTVNSWASVGMEEVADKLRQSALQSSTAKRRHLSLAEQALENEAEMDADEQPVCGGHSQSIAFERKSFVDSVRRNMVDDSGRGNDGDDLGTPPPTKHGRTD